METVNIEHVHKILSQPANQVNSPNFIYVNVIQCPVNIYT